MLKLYVLRHGKAVNANSEMDDGQRSLNKKGTAQINQIGYILNNEHVKIDFIVSSKARRTFETAQIMNHFLQCENVQFDADLYLCDAEKIFNTLSKSKVDGSILYVGHNNGISDFVNQLCNENILLSTGMLIEIEIDLNRWEYLSPGTGNIINSIVPNTLSF